MASERDRAVTQAQAIADAQAAATKRAAVPLWYWVGTGAGVGFAMFAVSGGNLPLYVAAILTLTLGSRLLNVLLTRIRGIRVTSVIGSASWLVAPYAIVIGGVFVLTFTVMKHSGQWWPGALTAAIAILVHVAFGLGVDRLRRHPEDLDG